MSETKTDPAALAKTLRSIAGDGSVGWVMEPIQAGFLLDVADALDGNAKLLKELDAEHALAETLGHYHEDVKAENDKLRELVERLFGRLLELLDENDKLRELVRDMWPHVRHRSRVCRECELSCDTSDECLLYEPMRQRMRELGIEVDE